MDIKDWIACTWDKWSHQDSGLIKSGVWRVVYTEGGRSTGMRWNCACDYADIFGGQVIHPRTGDHCWYKGRVKG